jgi:hypothetical protein
MAFDLVEDIAVLIETAISNAIVKGEFSATDDNCIAVTPSGGFDPTHTFGGGDSSKQKPIYIEPTFQIACRHLVESTLDTWWDSIKSALDGKTNYTPTGTTRTYLFIKQMGDVMPLGRDDNRRHIQTLNFNTMIIGAY